jgi:hypothetical protein
MFNAPTLFVIGAGASYEAGMPLGNKLLEQIKNALDMQYNTIGRQESGSFFIADALQKHIQSTGEAHRPGIQPYLSAAWTIRDMAPMNRSIDNILDRRQNDDRIVLCGKLAIAECILVAEKKQPPIFQSRR